MYEEIVSSLRESLTDVRFDHTMGVCEAAVSLAIKFGESKEKAYLAALLHDCGRILNVGELLKYCNQYGIELDEYVKKDVNLIHALVGADMAKRHYGVDDDYVLTAVKRHTTGCADMTLLDKIIFVADAIEPNRAGKDVDEARHAAEYDLDAALPLALRVKTRYITAFNGTLHPDSVQMLAHHPA